MPAYGTASNVYVGLAQIFTAPANTAPTAITASSGLYPTPSAPWVASGFTAQGAEIGVDRKTDTIMVEEQSTPVAILTDSQTITVSFEFAEDTIANMQLAYGGGTITNVAKVLGTTAPSTSLALSDTLTQLAILLIGVNPQGFGRSIYVPNVIATGKVSTRYRRAKNPRTYPAVFTAICPASAVVVTDYTGTD